MQKWIVIKCNSALVRCHIVPEIYLKNDADKDAEKNKVLKNNEQWEDLKERSHSNIQSERGILRRQTRSI